MEYKVVKERPFNGHWLCGTMIGVTKNHFHVESEHPTKELADARAEWLNSLGGEPVIPKLVTSLCKDCMYWKKIKSVDGPNNVGICDISDLFTSEADYCSFGKRKSGGDE